MIFLISSILSIISIVLFILSATFFVECLTASFSNKLLKRDIDSGKENNWLKSSIAVVIPAHNEELVIAKTLESIIPQLKSIDKLLVVADNCDDGTSEIVTEMGGMVVERKDTIKRGKGYALEYGLQQLQDNPPEVVIFVDADCIVESKTLEILTNKALKENKPIQSLYLMEKPESATPKDYISAFAVKVKNLVRPLGLYTLNQPCLLTGTGMAFPWQVINSVKNLGSGEIVEDMKLGIDLAILGYAPKFCPEVKVIGMLPQQNKATTTQRTRWEHGHLQTILTYVPQLFLSALRKRQLSLLSLAIDLAIPPLSLFVLLCLISIFINLLYFLNTLVITPLILSIFSILMISLSIFMAWKNFATDDLPLSVLIKTPLYILWKLPIYLKFFTKKERNWIRTDRNN